MSNELPQAILQELAALDSCGIADAIETFSTRLRNEGFNDPTIHWSIPNARRMLGYAVTFKIRSGDPPMKPDYYLDRTNWWTVLDHSDVPKIVVIEDVDAKPGRGALVGRMHVTILKALGCQGVVTNGAIRGVHQFERLMMPAFARNVSVSHAYVHVIETGAPVSIAGIRIKSGDLIHGDANGLVNIPIPLADQIPATVQKLRSREEKIQEFCLSDSFTMAKLQELIRNTRL